MSNEAITWAFKQEGLTMTEKFVLIALADYANENHMCFPAHEKTAKRVAASKSTVQRAVKGLENKGLLRVVSWHRPNGSTTSNRYQLRVGGQFDHGGVVNLTTGGSQSDTRAGYPDDYGAMVTGDHPLTPSSYPPGEPPLNGSAPDGDAPAELALPPEATSPEEAIAKRAYDATDGALKFMAIKAIAKWALERKNATPERVEQAIADLHHRGKPVTRATVDQQLTGAFDRQPWRQDNNQRMAAARKQATRQQAALAALEGRKGQS